jgi:HEAT repeat protein
MPTLQALLSSSNQSVRLNAALAAGTYPERDFIEVLVAQCATETDFFVRDTLSWALMRHDRKLVVERLKVELNSPISQARSQALHTFSKIGDKSNYPLITKSHLLDADDTVALTAWRTASVLVPEEEKPALVKILMAQLGTRSSEVQFDLTRFLCNIGEEIVVPITEAANSADEAISMHAKLTLIRFKEMQLEFMKNSK